MENKTTLGILISVALAILLGVILVSILADQTVKDVQLTTVTDTVNIAPLRMIGGGLNYTLAESNKLYASKILSVPASTSWRTDISDCAISTVKFYNQSGALMSNSADYVWVTDGNGIDGWLRLQNVLNLNSSMTNSTTITYNTCPTGYVNGWAATIYKLVPGFFVLAILLGAVFVIFWILKREGIELNI